MEKWYLLYCKPKQEFRAQQHLQNQGLTSFVPVIQCQKIKAGKKQPITEPLFPRYLFLYVPNTELNLSSIRSTRGVSDFVRFGGQLATVPAHFITELTSRQILLQRQTDRLAVFSQGDKLTVSNGTFAGLDAVFDMPDGELRSMVLINILGQPVKTSIGNEQLERKDTALSR